MGQRLFLRRRDAVRVEDYGRYAPGARVPALLPAPLEGKRASVQARGVWRDGRWILEIRRKLDTGDPHDVSFADLSARYAFAVAIFDAQEFEHSYAVGVQWLELE